MDTKVIDTRAVSKEEHIELYENIIKRAIADIEEMLDNSQDMPDNYKQFLVKLWLDLRESGLDNE